MERSDDYATEQQSRSVGAFHLAHRLEDDARHADLMQGRRGRQPADAAADDEYVCICHGPICHLRSDSGGALIQAAEQQASDAAVP